MNPVSLSVWPLLAVLFCVALAGSALGIWLADIPEMSRRVVPFSGGLLMGIAVFWVIPEIAEQSGWAAAAIGIVLGFGVLAAIDRLIYPVCPACSHTHDHSGCEKSLHGFTTPLLMAASVHSLFDGWSIGVSQEQRSGALKIAFLTGIAVHKLPEGMALGVLLIASTGAGWKALAGAAAVQSAMAIGALGAIAIASHLAPAWMAGLLATAAGVFIYLGYHAIESQSRDRGFGGIMMPALTGAAGAAVLRLVPGF